jgi:hypothetical protein
LKESKGRYICLFPFWILFGLQKPFHNVKISKKPVFTFGRRDSILRSLGLSIPIRQAWSSRVEHGGLDSRHDPPRVPSSSYYLFYIPIFTLWALPVGYISASSFLLLTFTVSVSPQMFRLFR